MAFEVRAREVFESRTTVSFGFRTGKKNWSVPVFQLAEAGTGLAEGG